jgi:tetratricopeptide (TPR) repeat protein
MNNNIVNTANTTAIRHYNPDWLSDDDLVRNFAARLDDFGFLRDELARVPREGSAQHYLLVGVRGAGKTTMLKRLAVAIRRDADLRDHLIALSFPEELYQVKNLADFWWAACDALLDELDRMDNTALADQLSAAIEQGKSAFDRQQPDPLSDAGLRCLQQSCAALDLRPVLLVDNLDMIFERIDKSGRKLKNAHAPAYWALRESLSTTTSPIVIGGSVRLSEPFTDVDKAFYDFFIPKRLGKLSLAEVNQVLQTLADTRGLHEVGQRLQQHPGRIETLYELTGGNPRALGLIFELLRQGPNSRAVEDFEHLMDITTPYYKARFEDLAEQAQAVMHALAVCRPADNLHFGLTAAEVGQHTQLATNSVSAQLDTLAREGLVEKTATHGRTQYRIAEQLFRLWLQMRATRRIRQNALGLTRFLEAMYSLDEMRDGMQEQQGPGSLAGAKLAFAVADMGAASSLQRGLEAKGIEQLMHHLQQNGGKLDDYVQRGDLAEETHLLLDLGEQLRNSRSGLDLSEQEALLGAVRLSLPQKQALVQDLLQASQQPTGRQPVLAQIRQRLALERQDLLRDGLHANDLAMLHHLRTLGCLPLPYLTVQDAEAACPAVNDPTTLRAMLWRLLGARMFVKIGTDSAAQDWLAWGQQHAPTASANEGANVAGTLRLSGRLAAAQQALELACLLGETARTWFERAVLLRVSKGDIAQAEQAYRKAIELDPADAWPWHGLGNLLTDKLQRHDEAEQAYRKAIELDPAWAWPWIGLGYLLTEKLKRHDEAKQAYRKAIELDPAWTMPWNNLGILLTAKLKRHDEAEQAYRKAIELNSAYALPWNNLGNLLAYQFQRHDEAEQAYRKAIELDPAYALPHYNLGLLLTQRSAWHDAAAAYARGWELQADIDPFYRIQYADLQARLFTTAAQQALAADDALALRSALAALLAESVDIATSLASTQFVEDFLAPALAQHAALVLPLLRELDIGKHARPLLLAAEAVAANRMPMLDDLEPEVQGATRRMVRRLGGKAG